MKFERIRLEHFKCYGDADLRLDEGVTVIHGLNGSGKSSLLEACFFALYGATALDSTLDEVVTIGAEEATVELWFAHAGESYHVERRIRVSGDSASNWKCILEAPGGTYEGARDVRQHIAELLRMDAEAFVNCAYVRQGEVNKLINASPGDRQDMIDDLLQLGKLEAYRERASKARLGVKHVRDGKRELLEDREVEIERREEKDLHGTLNDLESRLAEVDAERDRYEENREEAVQTRDEAQSILDEYEQRREELEELRERVTDLREDIEATERERDELADRIRNLNDEADDVRDRRESLLVETDLSDPDGKTVEERLTAVSERIEDLREDIEDHRLAVQNHEREAESLREDATDREQRASEKRDRADELAHDLDATREKLADRREKLATLDEEIEATEETFADAPVDPEAADDHWDELAEKVNERREREAELETELANAEASLEEAEELLDAGKCPECGQPVADSPHVEAIDEYRERVADCKDELVDVRGERERLEEQLDRANDLVDAANDIQQLRSNRKNIAQLVEEQSEGVDETETQIAETRSTAEELDAEAAEKREAAAAAEAAAEERREALAEAETEREGAVDRRDRLESVVETFERERDIEADVARLREQRENKADLNDERRDRLADMRDREADLEAEFDESAIETARTERERATDYIEKVDPKLDELHEERDDLTGRIGGVKNEIEALENLREQRDDLAATVDHLDTLYEEAEELQEMYGQLRTELRQRNVESLERMLNETFELVYQNDAYSRIELDGEYELTVYQKDGEPLDPEQLSGGERALFNLSLRCAIYRLLAEGIEGAAPTPPLILDEPTVFLDSGHVSQLVELIDSMRELGVEQIVVVSHDEELVGVADDLVTVRKDATTNRSTVTRAEADIDALPALD